MVTASPSARKVRVVPSARVVGSVPPQDSSIRYPNGQPSYRFEDMGG